MSDAGAGRAERAAELARELAEALAACPPEERARCLDLPLETVSDWEALVFAIEHDPQRIFRLAGTLAARAILTAQLCERLVAAATRVTVEQVMTPSILERLN